MEQSLSRTLAGEKANLHYDPRLPMSAWLMAACHVFVLTVKRYFVGTRSFLAIGLFAIPVGLAGLANFQSRLIPPEGIGPPRPTAPNVVVISPNSAKGKTITTTTQTSARPGVQRQITKESFLSVTEKTLIFYLFPHVLIPLICLLYASAMIQDELDEQTLTYLLLRPIPRWGIYISKWAAVAFVIIILQAIFLTATYFALYVGQENFSSVFPMKPAVICGVYALGALVYCAIFGFYSVLMQRSFWVGFVQILVVEGFLGNFPFSIRLITVIYHLRVLLLRSEFVEAPEWRITLSEDFSTLMTMLILASVAAICLFASGYFFSRKEFRMKTPTN